jgi:hypothetical protein
VSEMLDDFGAYTSAYTLQLKSNSVDLVLIPRAFSAPLALPILVGFGRLAADWCLTVADYMFFLCLRRCLFVFRTRSYSLAVPYSLTFSVFFSSSFTLSFTLSYIHYFILSLALSVPLSRLLFLFFSFSLFLFFSFSLILLFLLFLLLSLQLLLSLLSLTHSHTLYICMRVCACGCVRVCI